MDLWEKPFNWKLKSAFNIISSLDIKVNHILIVVPLFVFSPEKRSRRTRRSTIAADGDSSQSQLPVASPERVKPSPEKVKPTPEKVKLTPEKVKPTPEKVKLVHEKVKHTPEKVKPSSEKLKQSSEKVKPSSEKVKPTPEKSKPTPEKVKPPSERIKASLLKSPIKNEIPEPPVSKVIV